MMKQKSKILFYFLMGLLFSFSPVVKAKNSCIYKINSSEKQKIILETGTNENQLTSGSGFNAAGSSVQVRFFDSAGLPLENGNCPTISVQTDSWSGNYIIYQSQEACKNDQGTHENCTGALTGTKGDSSQSISSNTNSRKQFKLSNSTDSSCQYISEPNQDYHLTVNGKNNQQVSFSCSHDSMAAGSCTVSGGSNISFYQNGTFYCPAFVYAEEEYGGGSNYTQYILKLQESGTEADEDRDERVEDSTVDLDDFNGKQTCEGIFGTTDANGNFTKESFGWLIQTALNYIKIAGPILVILLSMVEFIKAIASSDEEAMKKAQSRLVIRLIAVVALFLLPFIIGEVLKLINGISNPTCGFK